MNIFWLDNDPVICAMYHNDKHIVKMPLELAQLLCTAHHEYGTNTPEMYKPTHRNHPCAVWVREGSSNYYAVYYLLCELLKEYTYRYGRSHKCEQLLDCLLKLPYKIHIKAATPAPQCVPDDCKDPDVVQAYRKYYSKHKRHLAGWTRRFDPPWF